MRIVHLIPTLGLGGAERQLVTIATALAREHDVRVIALQRSGPLARELEATGVRVEVLGARGLRDLRAMLRLARALRGADLVQTWELVGNVLGGAAAALARVPVVATIATVLGHGDRSPLQEKAERAALRLARGVVTNCEAARGSVIARYAIAREKIDVVPNAVAVPAERAPDPRALGFERGPVVLSLARLAPEKEPLLLLRSFVRAGVTVGLAFAGAGPMKDEVERAAGELGIADRVRFLGARADGPTLPLDADLVALASSREGMPNALLEAAACGRAVVATSVGGVPEVVRDGETGLLVRPGDEEAFAAALRTMMLDARRREEMGARARARMGDEFSLAKHVARMSEVYERALLGATRGQ
jgi:glycosyltransferase involved in cell wall biosynthesis